MNDKIFKVIDSATRQGYAIRFDRDEVQPQNIMIALVKDNYRRMCTISTLTNHKCADLFLGNVLEMMLEEACYDLNEVID